MIVPFIPGTLKQVVIKIFVWLFFTGDTLAN